MSKSIDKPTGTAIGTKEMLMFNPTTGLMERITLASLSTFFGTGDITAPTVVSATCPNAADNTVIVVFSESVTVTTAGWSFKKNGVSWSISSVSGSGTTWTFTMGSSADSDDVLLRSYDSTTGATVDASTNELATFTDISVTNDVAFPHISNFTAANGTLISAYTPDSGNAWTLGTSSIWEIQSNRATPKLPFPGGNLPTMYISDMPQAYTFRTTFSFTDGTPTVVLYVRANTGLTIGVQCNINHTAVDIYDLAAGTTLLGSGTWATSFADHLFEIVVSGTTVNFYRDAVLEAGPFSFNAGNNGTVAAVTQAGVATVLTSFDSIKAELV